jgi:hypothetical protein
VATPGIVSSEAAVITWRGPKSSMCRPTQIPTPAETNWASENAPVIATLDQPVSAVMED